MPMFFTWDGILRASNDIVVNVTDSSLALEPLLLDIASIFSSKQDQQRLQRACQKLAPCSAGKSVVMKCYGLPNRYILHMVRPVRQENELEYENLLRSCYRSALKLAVSLGVSSLNLPVIYANLQAGPSSAELAIARNVVADFLENPDSDLEIYLLLPTENEITRAEKVKERIIEEFGRHLAKDSLPSISAEDRTYGVYAPNPAYDESLNEAVTHLAPGFSDTLFRLIDQKGYTDVEVYKRANMDRRLFAKFRKDQNYHPQKRTVLALAIALKLTDEETENFLQSAGYSLSYSQKRDVIIAFFLKQKDYDIYLINEALFYFGEEQL